MGAGDTEGADDMVGVEAVLQVKDSSPTKTLPDTLCLDLSPCAKTIGLSSDQVPLGKNIGMQFWFSQLCSSLKRVARSKSSTGLHLGLICI